MRARKAGSRATASTSRPSRARIGFGTAAGASRPNQAVASKPAMPASCIVGTSGSTALRTAPVVASARNCPSRQKGRAEGMLSMPTSTRPAMSSVSIGALPR